MPDPRELEVQATRVLARTLEICQIPAPPLDEGDRAELVTTWWRQDGLREVQLDHAGNVWALLRPGTGSGLAVAAHLDTVFPRTVAHGTTRAGSRLIGPGVGDNSVAVAALSTLDMLLPGDLPGPLWLIGTVGEEGLGNLHGIRAALQDPARKVAGVIALEGNYLGRVNTVGIGSHRIRVVLTGRGGHAWEDADVPSVVHVGGHLVAALDTMPRPPGRSAVNVGTLDGGESINARARHLTLTLDLRAEDQPALDELVATTQGMINQAVADTGVEHRIEVIGSRPAGRIDPSHPLVEVSVQALAKCGISAQLTAASTDANAAYASGIPAVTLGITTGELTHTESEWIEIEPISNGLRALAETIATYATLEEV